MGESSQTHHDSGACQKYSIKYKGKLVLVLVEDYFSGDYNVELSKKIGGVDAGEVFDRDTAESFTIANIESKHLFLAKSHACTASWLCNRHLISLQNRCNEIR